MASKKPLQTGPNDIDDFSFGNDEFDIQDNRQEGSRKPPEPIGKGIGEAFKSHFSDKSVLRTYVGKALPSQYGSLFDDYNEITSSLDDTIREVRDVSDGPLNTLAKGLQRKIPNRFKRTKKLLDKIQDATQSYNFSNESSVDNTSQIIASQMEAVFGRMEEERQAEREEDSIKDALDQHNSRRQIDLMARVARSSEFHMRFTQGIQLPYMKKSLELQYRMAMGIGEMVKLMHGWSKQQRVQLDNIIEGVALPEVQKLRMSENFKQNIRNKFIDKTIGQVAGADSPLKGMLSNFKENTLQTVQLAMMGIDGVNEGLANQDQDDDFGFEDDGMNDQQRKNKERAKKITNFLLNNVLTKAVGDISKAQMRKNPRFTKKVFAGARKIGAFRNNFDSNMREFSYKDTGILNEIVGMMTGAKDMSGHIDRAHGAELSDAADSFDKATRRSIVEVIPGYLGRILQELQITRTGDTSIAPLVFDFKKSRFVSQKQMLADIEKKATKGSYSSQRLDEIVAEVERTGAKLTPEQKDELKRALLLGRKSGRVMNERSLSNASYYENLIGGKNNEALAKAMGSYFGRGSDGKFKSKARTDRAKDRLFSNLASTDGDDNQMRALMQQLINEGKGDLAYASGWVNEDGEIDVRRVIDGMAGVDTRVDVVDTTVPTGFSKGTKNRRLYANSSRAKAIDQNQKLQTKAMQSECCKESIEFLKTLQENSFATNNRLDSIIELLQEQAVKIAAEMSDVLAKIVKRSDAPPGTQEQANPSGLKERFSNLVSNTLNGFESNNDSNTNDDGRGQQTAKGFFERTIKENLNAFSKKGKRTLKRLGVRANRFNKEAKNKLFGFDTSWVGGLKDRFSSTRLLGAARTFKDYIDGMPEVGDIFIPGVRDSVISAYMLSSGRLTDATGKVITSLKDLAEAKGDILDETGQVVLAHVDLLRSYVKSDGKIFIDVWQARIKRAAGTIKDGALFASAKAILGARFVSNSVKSVAKEALNIITPIRDVYVLGEKNPRLYAHRMKLGHYINRHDGSPIERPTSIKGAVLDIDGNEVLSDNEFSAGLFYNDGTPVRTIGQRLAMRAAANAQKAKELFGRAARSVVGGIKTAGRFTSTFLSRGLTGVMGGSWKSAKGGLGSSEYAGMDGQVILLTEIRDILYATLVPRSDGSGASLLKTLYAGSKPGASANASFVGPMPSAHADVSHQREESNAGTGEGFNGLLSGAASLASNAASGAFNAFKNWRRKRKGLSPTDSAVISDSQEEKTDPKEQAKEVAKEVNKATKKAKKQKPTKPQVDTSDMRQGSAQERMANWKNINEHNVTLADVQTAERMERKNTIDMVTDAIKKGFGAIAGMFGAAGEGLDMLDFPDGGDVEGDKRNRKRKGGKGKPKPPSGKAPKPKGKVSTPKGKAGMLRRALSSSGRFLFGDVGGAGRRAATAARWGRAGMGAAKFVGKRAIMPVFAGIAAVLGAPVIGTAIAVGGAVWTMYELYKFLEPKKKDLDGSHFQNLRITEYGFSPSDTNAASKMMRLESMLKPALSIKGDSATLDEDNINAQEIMTMFGISLDDEKQVTKFIDWFNNRFKPTYFKWVMPAHAIKEELSSLDKVSNEQKMKLLDVTAGNTGWDYTVNPFGVENLRITSKEIIMMRKDLKALFAQKSKTPGLKETATKQELMQSGVNSINEHIKHGPKASALMQDKVTQEMVERGNRSSKMASYTSQALLKTNSANIGELMSIRLRLYGYTEPTFSNVAAISQLEETISEEFTFDASGAATLQEDKNVLFSKVGKFFGLSASSSQDELRFFQWFDTRFMPVFATFVGAVKTAVGRYDELLLMQTGSAGVIYSTATTNAGVANWDVTVMPTQGTTACTDSSVIKPFMLALEERASKEKIQEKVKTTSVVSKAMTPSPTSVSYDPAMKEDFASKFASLQSSKVQPAPLPDAEQEPQTKGSFRDTSAAKAQTSASAIPMADGELSAGSNGWSFIKAPSKHAIDNLHPEVRKLFLAMAEEYGTKTKQTIQVNRGWSSPEEQARLHRSDPKKAAKAGGSLHEVGLALDINTVDLNRLEGLGLLRKYGFTRPVGGETWHLEPAGIQDDIGLYRKDPQAAAQAIVSGVGKGGGGVGATKTGFRFGGRDSKYAASVMAAASTQVKAPGASAVDAASAQTAATRTAVAGAPGQASVGVAGGSATSAPSSASTGGVEASNGSKAYDSLPNGGDRDSNKQVVAAAAKMVGIDPNIGLLTAAMESSFNHNASAGKAKGLKGFMPGTWDDMMRENATKFGIPSGTSPTDPKAASLLGAQYLKDNLDLASKMGINPSIETAYLMHFLGTSGGLRAIQLPDDANMVAEFPTAAKLNKPYFYNSDGSPRTKAQFMQFVRSKLQKTASSFGISIDSLGQSASSAPAKSAKAAPSQGERQPFSPGVSTPRTNSGGFFEASASTEARQPANSSPVEKQATQFYTELVKLQGDQVGLLTQIAANTLAIAEVVKSNGSSTNAPIDSGMVKPGAETPVEKQAPISRMTKVTREVTTPSFRMA